MQRTAFQLRVRAGMEEAYDRAHQSVWPELLAEFAAAGVREYSIFRRGQDLFLYLLVPNSESFFTRMDNAEVNLRWQKMMAPLLEAVPSLQAGERFAAMQEVFYLPGAIAPNASTSRAGQSSPAVRKEPDAE